MLATRVIPTLLARGNQLVKGERFDSWRSVGHVRQAVRVHNARGTDELIYLDIAATPEGRGPDFALVESFAAECAMPLTVGGGVRSVEDVRRLLECGADKVAICTGAHEVLGLIHDSSQRFGAQAIVAAIDVRDGHTYSHCGRTRMSGGNMEWYDATFWASIMNTAGAGEILLTSIDRDGTLEGYDLELIRSVSQMLSIPVIANGGAGTYEHMLEAVKAGAHAVAAGAMFAWTDHTPKGASQYLQAHGIEARV